MVVSQLGVEVEVVLAETVVKPAYGAGGASTWGGASAWGGGAGGSSAWGGIKGAGSVWDRSKGGSSASSGKPRWQHRLG